jgi:hypothetical protein
MSCAVIFTTVKLLEKLSATSLRINIFPYGIHIYQYGKKLSSGETYLFNMETIYLLRKIFIHRG